MKAPKHLILMIAATALLALSACSPLVEAASPGQTPSPAVLANTRWRLDSFGAVGAEKPILPGATLTLDFDDQGLVSGQGGCNSFGGQYKLDNGSLTFGNLAQTLRACADDTFNQQEAQYMLALGATGRYELTGDHLTIFYDNGASALHYVKA